MEVEKDNQEEEEEEAEFEVHPGNVKTEKQLLAHNTKTLESSTAVVGAVPVQTQHIL